MCIDPSWVKAEKYSYLVATGYDKRLTVNVRPKGERPMERDWVYVYKAVRKVKDGKDTYYTTYAGAATRLYAGRWYDATPFGPENYYPGFHGFKKAADAWNYMATHGDALVKVRLEVLTAYGSQGYWSKSPTWVGKRMKILGECYRSGRRKPATKKRARRK